MWKSMRAESVEFLLKPKDFRPCLLACFQFQSFCWICKPCTPVPARQKTENKEALLPAGFLGAAVVVVVGGTQSQAHTHKGENIFRAFQFARQQIDTISVTERGKWVEKIGRLIIAHSPLLSSMPHHIPCSIESFHCRRRCFCSLLLLFS
jgi:hypothetical protein